jgi:hypothetical protein
LIHGFLGPYLKQQQQQQQQKLAPEKKGLPPESFLILSPPGSNQNV